MSCSKQLNLDNPWNPKYNLDLNNKHKKPENKNSKNKQFQIFKQIKTLKLHVFLSLLLFPVDDSTLTYPHLNLVAPQISSTTIRPPCQQWNSTPTYPQF